MVPLVRVLEVKKGCILGANGHRDIGKFEKNIWLYGYMAIWLYGYMAIWLYGYMAYNVSIDAE